MSERGLFITMEGGEGVGKSTNMTFLESFLVENGVEVTRTREPGGTRLGEDIRNLLLRVREEPVSTMAELLLLFAARAQHIHEVIEPTLASGRWILCDRFTDATYAYQCGGRGLETESVRLLEELVQRELRPDYTLLLNAPVSLGMARARGRGELDRFEQEDLEFFERVRTSYIHQQARSSSGRYRMIDASLSLDDVQTQVLTVGRELLSCWKVRRPES